MTRRLISTGSPFEKKAGYSRAVISGDWCFVSGTTGYDYATMTMPQSVTDQTRNALGTIATSLEGTGFALRDTVRARYIVTDRADVPAVFAVLGERFGDIRPAATMIVADLIEEAMKVEIELTLYRDEVDRNE